MEPVSRTAVAGGPIHFLDFGGQGPPIVLVHGLGGSATNWLSVGPRLSSLGRTMAIDLVGFGRTPPEGRGANLSANRELVHAFLTKVVGEPAVLIGNSMGGAIALMEAAAAPAAVSRLVLVAAAQPAPRGTSIDREVFAVFAMYSLPWVGEWYMKRRAARLGAEGLVREMMALCCADPAGVDPVVKQAHVDAAAERLARMPWAHSVFLAAARSVVGSLRQRRKWDAMAASVAAPTLLVHGTHDRLVPLAASQRLAALRPDWTLEVYPGIGHVPMLEAPDRFVDSLARWLARPAPAAASPSRGRS
jgi:pimeloyl-ACP methyl ester carboxylesterase